MILSKPEDFVLYKTSNNSSAGTPSLFLKIDSTSSFEIRAADDEIFPGVTLVNFFNMS